MASEALQPEQIRDLVSDAGMAGVRSGLHERLVFYGRWRQTLDAYDEHGRVVGAAERLDGRNKRAGYRYHYEFGYERPDGRIQCALRDVTGRQTGARKSHDTFSVLGAQGAELASIVGIGESVPTLWGLPKPNEFEIACAGAFAGRFRPSARGDAKLEASSRSKGSRLGGQAWCLQDRDGRDLARITHLRRQRPNNAYVVEIDPNITEPLRTIAPTFCVIADNLLVDRSRLPMPSG